MDTQALITIQPPPPEALFTTREAWLASVAATLRPEFEASGATLPEKIRFSTGWPSMRATGSARRIGECHYANNSADSHVEIFISPSVGDAIKAAATLVHELVHACLQPGEGHGKEFRRLAKAMGLEGKMTATVPGPLLVDLLNSIIELVGPYPHAELRVGEAADKPKKQTTRMIKVSCPDCDDYIARMSRKNIARGLPICPCGAEMVAETSEDDPEDGGGD